MPVGDEKTIVKAICPSCLKWCGIDCHVENGKIKKIMPMKEHPLHTLCPKGLAAPEWLYSGKRMTRPLKKTEKGWQEVSLKQVIEEIAAKLSEIRQRYGARSLALNLGNPFIGTHISSVAKRFCSLYGTPNYTAGGSLCFAAKAMGHGLSLSGGSQPLFASYSGTRCAVLWGYNPQECEIGEYRNVLEARKNGAKLIVIDPRRTPLAGKADIHAQIKPGTDAALGLGLLNVIIEENLYDREFVEKWTLDFDKLKEHVRLYTPEFISKTTWIEPAQVREIARLYATSKPACIAQGVAVEHNLNGVYASRAISALATITGNLDVNGGNAYFSRSRQANLRVKENTEFGQRLGEEYPLFGRVSGEASSMPLPDAILTGKPYPVKALVIQGSNPLLTWPNSGKVKAALSQLELLVVSDLFMTPTAEMANYFIPAVSLLESEILRDYSPTGIPLLIYTEKAGKPPSGCIEDWKLWAELGKAMGYGESFSWQDSSELFSALLKPSGITLSQLKSSIGGYHYGQTGGRSYLKGGFSTRSGKVEFYSSLLKESGCDPLPEYHDYYQNETATEEKFPLILISGPRVMAYCHSRFRGIPSLKKLRLEPLLEINTETANNIGIKDKETVVVESTRGRIQLKVTLSRDIHPGVICVEHGWDEANVNQLSDDEKRDPVSGFPAFKYVPCRVKKLN